MPGRTLPQPGHKWPAFFRIHQIIRQCSQKSWLKGAFQESEGCVHCRLHPPDAPNEHHSMSGRLMGRSVDI